MKKCYTEDLFKIICDQVHFVEKLLCLQAKGIDCRAWAVRWVVCTAVLLYCYIQHRELCVQLYWCTVIYSTGNCEYSCNELSYKEKGIVYSCTGLLLNAAEEIVCTAVLVYCYIQQRLLCLQPYSCTVIYSTVNFVYSCTGLRLYTTHGIMCTAVLVYCYIQHRKLCLQLYWCTVIYSRGNRNCVYSCTGVQLYTPQAMRNCVYSCTSV